jgi:hypothetical protein
MGGYGSGRWGWSATKYAVEDSLVLAVGDYFAKQAPKRWSGSSRWLRNERETASLRFAFSHAAQGLVLTLSYSSSGEAVNLPIRIQESMTPLGGIRHWFTCPLVTDGVPCLRRCHKLYAAPNSKYFGCRQCMNLTYRSCQESHKFDGLFASLGSELGIDLEEVKFISQLMALDQERSNRKQKKG